MITTTKGQFCRLMSYGERELIELADSVEPDTDHSYYGHSELLEVITNCNHVFKVNPFKREKKCIKCDYIIKDDSLIN